MQTLKVEANTEQRTSDWHAARLGRITNSELHRLMTIESRPMTAEELEKEKKEGGRKKTVADPSILSAGAMTYVMECVSEVLTGKPADDGYVSLDMQVGIDREPIALSVYEAVFECKVVRPGFVPVSAHFGGSPDGIIDAAKGCLEVKCPKQATHVQYLAFKTLADLKATCKDYYWQMIGHLLVTRSEWCEFVSFNPDFPPALQLKVLRMNAVDVADDLALAKLKIDLATKEIDQLTTSLL